MRHGLVVSSVLLALSLGLQGCGGSQKDVESAQSAKKDPTAMDQLKAIPSDLSASVDDLMKPIDQTQAVVDEVTSLPSRVGVSASDVMAMASATVQNGTVQVKTNGDLSEDARSQIRASLAKLAKVVGGLKSTPDKVAALAKKLAEVTVKLPVLTTRVSTEAEVVMANPFAGADSKAKAKSNLESVKQVEEDVQKQVNDAQAKVVGIPTMATGALAKLSASFAGGAKSSD